ncbi:MAG: hypothetical protein QXM46_00010 [Candidatus Hadarchaeales archaeon]
MRELLSIFLSTWVLGPVGGTACASLEGFQPGQILLLVTLSNALIALFWLAVAELLFRRWGSLLYLVGGERRGALTLTGLALLAFSLGSMVAVMVAYVLGVGKRAFPLIAPCAVGSGALWTMGALGLLTFFPPFWLYLATLAATLILVSTKVYSRRELLRQALRSWREGQPGAVPEGQGLEGGSGSRRVR